MNVCSTWGDSTQVVKMQIFMTQVNLSIDMNQGDLYFCAHDLGVCVLDYFFYHFCAKDFVGDPEGCQSDWQQLQTCWEETRLVPEGRVERERKAY